jgi:hypothetical protein
MTFKLILNDSLRFFLGNLRQIITLCVPFLVAGAFVNYIVLENVDQFADPGSIFLLSLALNMALYPLYIVALILMMARQAQREVPTNTQLISDALGLYFPFLILFIIGMGLIWCGLLLFVFPGVYLAVRLAFAEFYLVVDRMDPREALIASFQATRHHWLLILTALALFALPIFGIIILVSNLLQATQAGAMANMAADAFISFLSLFMHVILFRIYMHATREAHMRPTAPVE